MNKARKQLIQFIEQKQKQLKLNQIIAYYGANIAKWVLFLANIIVVILAIIVVVIEVQRYIKIPTETKTILGDLGLTIVLATFIILTFFINIFLSVYRAVMKYDDYKKAQRELSYIYFQIEKNPQYSFADFESDYEKITKFYFTKKQVSKLMLVKKAVFGGKKWL
ncbi:Uncharacterised protein [Mesomycoplasma conjunctivae]|uniref:Uncharacterized protein n=1 Tax=Mesomycoplasma conjunctivae (strain ATCC 25834 / NCTC 10147 / HRC/581) TaxID=572263 RepID=C5J752_MESCH|nr:hypothetical protein [Mesomycoplasma conjunctivae]CAT05315.1 HYPOTHETICAL PROTEIN MCJ_006200 [Mesomycoplasma conjunctivae]VEU66543.1 Uncharacterised protein [Mesomycoplasma conjunctivae]